MTPYAFNLHVQDVGHTLVLGATGSGKSFLANFLVTHAQKYDPLTVILDLGHSYRKLATLLRGSYLEVGLRQTDVTINPFALEPTPENLHFLHAFVRVLLEGDDGISPERPRGPRGLRRRSRTCTCWTRSQRRLFTVANLLPRALAGRLHKWVDGGRYASLFDNFEDTLTVERLQVFDFEAMRAYPALLEPLLFYVLHRVTARIQDPAEAAHAQAVRDGRGLAVHSASDAARLRAGGPQDLAEAQCRDDPVHADDRRLRVGGSSAHGRRELPDQAAAGEPGAGPTQYAELFQLNEMELELLAGLIPRQQILLKRPDVTKVLTLTVDPKSYWIYTNTPIDNERVAAMFREYGFDAGLDRLAASA